MVGIGGGCGFGSKNCSYGVTGFFFKKLFFS